MFSLFIIIIDSDNYTQYTFFKKKKKENHPKLSKICSYWIFSKGLKNELDTAVVSEQSVFEPLKVYCKLVKTSQMSRIITVRCSIT